jgi:hypothetical protein
VSHVKIVESGASVMHIAAIAHAGTSLTAIISAALYWDSLPTGGVLEHQAESGTQANLKRP